MTRIIIEGIEPDKMRLEVYQKEDYGDWHFDAEGNVHVQIACIGDKNPWDDEDAFLVALHELVEARLCFKADVTQGAVDAFDAAYQGDGEPGDEPTAPYREQHRDATIIEHLVALFFGRIDGRTSR
jgi:hypothetical protein